MRAIRRLLDFRLTPRGSTLLWRSIAAIGFGLLGKTLLETGLAVDGGRGGFDASAYWNAARNLTLGAPLYDVEYGTFLAYSYPPTLAQLLTPFAFLPGSVFVWTWRAVELVCLRVAIGSWTRAGIAMLVFPPLIAEVEAGNVHLVMAAICALAMRGRSLPVASGAALKFATIPLVPLAWLTDRAGLVRGAGLALAVLAVSFLLAPGQWLAYLDFLRVAPYPVGAYNVAADIPVGLRLAAAAVLGLAAVRWSRLAPIAMLCAYPVVWFHALSTLVAVITPIPQAIPEARESGAPRLIARARAWALVPPRALVRS